MLNALETLAYNGLPDADLDAVILGLLENDGIEDDDEKRCLIAVAWHRDRGNKTNPTDCSLSFGDVVKVGGEEYRVLDDDERETAWEESLDSYLDDGHVEGADGPYFDREAWKKDARMEGAGPALSSYDGNEYEFSAGHDDWFLYRVS